MKASGELSAAADDARPIVAVSPVTRRAKISLLPGAGSVWINEPLLVAAHEPIVDRAIGSQKQLRRSASRLLGACRGGSSGVTFGDEGDGVTIGGPHRRKIGAPSNVSFPIGP